MKVKLSSGARQKSQGSAANRSIKPGESQSNPGTKMVYPEPCKELRRRPQLFLAGIVPYQPSSILIVAQVAGAMPSLPAKTYFAMTAISE